MAKRNDALSMIASGIAKVHSALELVVPTAAVPGEPALVAKVRPLFATALAAAADTVNIADNIAPRLAPTVADPTLSPEGRKQRAAQVNAEINAELTAKITAMRTAADAVNAALRPILSPPRPSSITDIDIDRAERHVLLELEQINRPGDVVDVLVRFAGEAIAENDEPMLWVATRDRRFIRAVLASKGASEHLVVYDAKVAQLIGNVAVSAGGDEAAARAISNALDAPYSLVSLVALVEQYVRLVQSDVPGFVAQLTPSGQR